MHRLRAERERVRVPDHLGDRERDDVAELAVLRRRAGGHAREEDRVLGRAEVLGEVLRRVRPGRLLEEHVRVLRRELLVEEPERRAEDQLVALLDEARHGLLELRAVGDVLLVRRLHLAAEHLLRRTAGRRRGPATSRGRCAGRRRSTRPCRPPSCRAEPAPATASARTAAATVRTPACITFLLMCPSSITVVPAARRL